MNVLSLWRAIEASGILCHVRVLKRRDAGRPLVSKAKSSKHGGDPTCPGEFFHVPKARQEITDDSCSSEETFPLKVYFRVKRALKDYFSSQSTLLPSLGFQIVLVLGNGIMIDTKWRFVTEFSLIEFLLPQIRSYKNHAFVFYTENYSTSPFDQLNRQTFSLVNIGNENPTFFDIKASSFLVMASNQLYFLFFLVVRVMYMLYVIK